MASAMDTYRVEPTGSDPRQKKFVIKDEADRPIRVAAGSFVFFDEDFANDLCELLNLAREWRTRRKKAK